MHSHGQFRKERLFNPKGRLCARWEGSSIDLGTASCLPAALANSGSDSEGFLECSVINILSFRFTTLFSFKKEVARSPCFPQNLAFGFILLCLGFCSCYCWFETRSFMEVQTNLEPTAVLSQSPNIAIIGMSHDA